jgi:phospholipid/cholesterol/gamma-HCH transport system substrate-binding protein
MQIKCWSESIMFLDKKSQQDLKNALSELSQTIAEFHKTSQSVNGMMADNKTHINGIVTDFHKVSSNFQKYPIPCNKPILGKTAKDLQATLKKVDDIMADLNSGKGTAGKMLKDEALYNNLTESTKELELLLQDLRLNPTRYVNVSLFGKKNKPYVAPTSTSGKKIKSIHYELFRQYFICDSSCCRYRIFCKECQKNHS